MIRVGVVGARGRLGSLILREIEEKFKDTVVVTWTPKRGDTLNLVDEKLDVVIEVASPDAALDLLKTSDLRVPVLIGSTGWDESQKTEMRLYAEKGGTLGWVRNFSVGVMKLRQILNSLSRDSALSTWQVEIQEWHHAKKKDSPSGTALALAECFGKNVPIQSFREGEIVGTHEVRFIGSHETLTFKHEVWDRRAFAIGAVECAIRLAEKKGKFPLGRVLQIEDLF